MQSEYDMSKADQSRTVNRSQTLVWGGLMQKTKQNKTKNKTKRGPLFIPQKISWRRFPEGT